MKRIIFIDLDSTMTHRSNKHKTTTDNINAIKTAQKQGMYVVIATGRSLEDAKQIHEQIKYDPHYGKYLITSNGSFISTDFEDEGDVLSREMDLELAKRISEFAHNKKAMVKPSYSKEFFGTSRWQMKFVGFVFRLKGYPWRKAEKLEFPVDKKLGKLSMVIGGKKQVKNFIEELSKEFGNEVEITTSGGGFYIETTMKGVTKGSAAEILAEQLGVDLKNSAHFGDSSNDIELLKKVGYPVVVDNASKRVKEHATYITESDKNSGVAKGIKHLMHNEWK